MTETTQKKTIKGLGFGDEPIIGELVKYRRGVSLDTRRARIAILDADDCDFDLLFEVSREFIGFVCLGEYDKRVADMAEELRLVGMFSEDEPGFESAVNEKAILIPQESKAILSPDINELKAFETAALAKDARDGKNTLKASFLKPHGKKEKKKAKKYFKNT